MSTVLNHRIDRAIWHSADIPRHRIARRLTSIQSDRYSLISSIISIVALSEASFSTLKIPRSVGVISDRGHVFLIYGQPVELSESVIINRHGVSLECRVDLGDAS